MDNVFDALRYAAALQIEQEQNAYQKSIDYDTQQMSSAMARSLAKYDWLAYDDKTFVQRLSTQLRFIDSLRSEIDTWHGDILGRND